MRSSGFRILQTVATSGTFTAPRPPEFLLCLSARLLANLLTKLVNPKLDGNLTANSTSNLRICSCTHGTRHGTKTGTAHGTVHSTWPHSNTAPARHRALHTALHGTLCNAWHTANQTVNITINPARYSCDPRWAVLISIHQFAPINNNDQDNFAHLARCDPEFVPVSVNTDPNFASNCRGCHGSPDLVASHCTHGASKVVAMKSCGWWSPMIATSGAHMHTHGHVGRPQAGRWYVRTRVCLHA